MVRKRKTQMKNENIWSGLKTPAYGELSAIRADPEHPFNFFYAINSDRHQMFILHLDKSVSRKKELPKLKGLRIQWTDSTHTLQLSLVNPQDIDLFAVLCKDLLTFTISAKSANDCLEMLFVRLIKWQRLLSKGGPRLLDAQEIRGLFAELTFMQKELIPRFGPDSVQFWKGPSGFPQDFATQKKIFEIKSHLVGSQQVVRISSPSQLWVESAELYLCVYHLTEVSAGGKSLGVLIDELASAIAVSSVASEEFDEKITSLGYMDLNEYRLQEFVVLKDECFLVSDSFPRIKPSSLNPGIQDLTYAIQLAALSPFLSTSHWSKV